MESGIITEAPESFACGIKKGVVTFAANKKIFEFISRGGDAVFHFKRACLCGGRRRKYGKRRNRENGAGNSFELFRATYGQGRSKNGGLSRGFHVNRS